MQQTENFPYFIELEFNVLRSPATLGWVRIIVQLRHWLLNFQYLRG